jgi:hypothetical protein
MLKRIDVLLALRLAIQLELMVMVIRFLRAQKSPHEASFDGWVGHWLPLGVAPSDGQLRERDATALGCFHAALHQVLVHQLVEVSTPPTGIDGLVLLGQLTALTELQLFGGGKALHVQHD